MSDTPAPRPGALVIDLGPVQEFEARLHALGETWARLNPRVRLGLSRLLWLHANGDMVVYRAPQDQVAEDDGEGG